VGTPYIFTKTLNTNVLAGFTSDTITMSSTFNFTPGTYQLKAWFSSVLDDTPLNDTLETSLVINPEMAVEINQVSGGTTNCLTGESDVFQTVTIYNTGNMDLSNIELILRIDTGATESPAYATIKETCTDAILAGASHTYTFKQAYKAPWKSDFYPRIFAYLPCDSALIDTITATIECVDAKDLYMVSIDNPTATTDNAGSSVQVSATVGNHDDLQDYSGLNITFLVENSQGEQTDKFTEMTGTIGKSSTASHTFSRSYTVPNDSVYYLTVYIDHYDNYVSNDTLRIKRTTDYTGIDGIESNAFTLGQNIPNPATNSTRIDYAIPEAGEVIFHVHSITGQLLYSQTIEAERGTSSIKLNTTAFAAGVYYYSIEYKGQKRMKRMSVTK
jgi:hypothetical protein